MMPDMSTVPFHRTFVIATEATTYTRTFAQKFSICPQAHGVPASSWVCEVLSALEAAADLRPLNTADGQLFVKTLDLLFNEPKATELFPLALTEIGRANIRSTFLLAEECWANSRTKSKQVRTKASTSFRKLVFDALRTLGLGEGLNRDTIKFRTKFTERPSPRPLISDQVDPSAPFELQAPSGALEHRTAVDLYAKAEAKLSFTVQRISDACIEELKWWAAKRSELLIWSRTNFSEAELALSARILAKDKDLSADVCTFQSETPPERQIGLYVRQVVDLGLANIRKPFSPVFWHGKELLTSTLWKDGQPLTARPAHIFCMTERMLSRELIAALVLLLTYTAWNVNALLNLSLDRVKKISGGYEIQGYKGKTDDHTPLVVIDSTTPYGREAINLILWNRERLVALGFLQPDETRLWFSWTVHKDRPYDKQFIGLQSALTDLIAKYKLPPFSFDQIRTQVLATLSARTRDPEIVRHVAGHRTLGTTGHYLDQLLLRRIHQAVNLEFQRRLENTVKFRLKDAYPTFPEPVQDRFVDLHLLMPVGDGSSCTNPTQPPDERYLDGNLCDGKRCHVGDGCPHRRIILDEPRLVELIRKRIYFHRHWARLESTNAEAFRQYVLPSMLFTLGLYDFVKASAHRHTLEAIEATILAHEQSA